MDLIEIQQASNTTFRLYDFNRLDKNGKHRRLDVREALQSIDYDAPASEAESGSLKIDYGKDGFNANVDCRVEILVECEYFTTTAVSLCPSNEQERACYTIKPKERDSFSILVVTDGEGFIDNEPITKGELLLLPASLKGATLSTNSQLSILEVHI